MRQILKIKKKEFDLTGKNVNKDKNLSMISNKMMRMKIFGMLLIAASKRASQAQMICLCIRLHKCIGKIQSNFNQSPIKILTR